jgi:hypothetical protein
MGNMKALTRTRHDKPAEETDIVDSVHRIHGTRSKQVYKDKIAIELRGAHVSLRGMN